MPSFLSNETLLRYVMELLDGLNAATIVRRFGRLSSARVVRVLGQICHSLSEAHARGLVHRDVTPGNIFLCRYGEDVDFVKVLDFGLVKAFDHSAETGPLVTREHIVHGTPGFIAPEQALGQSLLDGRVDIYATGCVAYWLLTGHTVFTAETPMAVLMHQRAYRAGGAVHADGAADPAAARPARAPMSREESE
jgi:serine/threonine-protein kinase